MSETPDLEVWRLAQENAWVITSKDGDFADMALLYGAPPKVIRLRIGNSPWQSPATVVNDHIDEVRAFLEDQASSLLLLGPRHD